MQRSSSGGEAGTRKAVAAIPPSPMRGVLPFAPVTGFSFVKSKCEGHGVHCGGSSRVVLTVCAIDLAPFAIAAATTSVVGKQCRGGDIVDRSAIAVQFD